MPVGPHVAWCASPEEFTELDGPVQEEATAQGEEARLYWVVSACTHHFLSPSASRWQAGCPL